MTDFVQDGTINDHFHSKYSTVASIKIQITSIEQACLPNTNREVLLQITQLVQES
jgi:hypothetical protein